MVAPLARFSDEVRSAVGQQAKILDWIEESLRYCESIPEISLKRKPPGVETFQESVIFRTRLFAQTSIHRTEQLLLGMIAETNALRLDTMVTLARSVVENCASVYYGYRRISAHKRNGQRDAMEECLTRLHLGAVKFDNPTEWKAPFTVQTLMSRMTEEMKNDAIADQYTWLSDFVHPNGPALNFFHIQLDSAAQTMHTRKKQMLNNTWALQMFGPVAVMLEFSEEGWKWMLGFQWKERRSTKR